MNRLIIIGNCTKDPELRTTQNGKSVCTFNVAVNRRKKANEQQPDADFFRVTVWDALGENCAKYLTKGKKVGVVGSVSIHVYTNSKGEPGASMEVMAQEVEFLSSRDVDQQSGMERVNPSDNPFPAQTDLPY